MSLYLRETLNFSSLIGGGAIAALHLASLIGLLVSTVLMNKWSQQHLLMGCGILATIGLLLVVIFPTPLLSMLGLILVGFSLAPITPIAFSMASKVSDRARGQAVSIVTISGYVSFILAPLLMGALGAAFTLRVSFMFLLVCSIGIVMITIFYRLKQQKV